MEDPDLSRSVEGYPSIDDYAVAMATLAAIEAPVDAIGAAEPACTDCEFGVATEPGAPVHRERIEELRDAIDALPDYRAGSRIMVRTVTYGPWQHLPARVISAFLEDEAASPADVDGQER